MDELIRRKDALNALNLLDAPFLPMNTAEHLAYVYALRNLPSVDAVEVVRCKDCKHFYLAPSGKGSCQRSKWSVFGIGLNGFCSYGERETDG